jgi:uncharacterized protein YwgA
VAPRGGFFKELNCYQKSSFGPFSPELKSIVTRLVNNGLIREEQLGRMFAVKVGPTFVDARKAYLHELAQWESIIEKTTGLFMYTNLGVHEILIYWNAHEGRLI